MSIVINRGRAGERNMAMLASAIAAVAVGAFAIGVLVIRRLAIHHIDVGHAKFKSVEIQDLIVRRLRVDGVIVKEQD